METSVKRLSPHSFALHTALVFAIIALLFILPMTLFMNAMTPNMPDGSMPAAMFGVMTFVMPVMYFVFCIYLYFRFPGRAYLQPDREENRRDPLPVGNATCR